MSEFCLKIGDTGKKPNPNHYSSDPYEKVSITELEVWRLFSR